MKLKLDENLGGFIRSILAKAGHDVTTVHEQGLCSFSDREVIRVCRAERRCLITLDWHFANPLVFNPRRHFGIVVLRQPRRITRESLIVAVGNCILALESRDPAGRLWIVEPTRLREYDPPESS